MSGCCSPRGYARIFNAKQARRALRKYRKDGLPGDAAFGVEFLEHAGIAGGTVLEVGGGIGAVQVELVELGAARSEGIELSPEYEDAAAELRRERGFEEQIGRRIGDFVATYRELADADAVVLFRVVCCYPDHEALLGAAAAKARRFVVFSFPPDVLLARMAASGVNVFLRLTGSDFRIQIHHHRDLRAALESRGFRLAARGRNGLWSTFAFAR